MGEEKSILKYSDFFPLFLPYLTLGDPPFLMVSQSMGSREILG